MHQLSTKKVFRLLLVLLCSYPGINAYAQLTVSGEIRPRTEFRNGFKTLNTQADEPAFFIDQRSRLSVGYRQEKLSFQLTLQDVRTWGNTSQIYRTDPALFNMYEAWGAYHFSERSSLRIGRQALDYDNARFLGNLDWAQQGRSHDAVRYIFSDSSGLSLHAALAYNQDVPFEPTRLSGNYYGIAGNYKTMQFVWMHKDWTHAKISLLLFNEGRQTADSSLTFRQTMGMIGSRSIRGIRVEAEAYAQTGKDLTGKTISAWLLALNASVSSGPLTVTPGVDYVSGTGAQHTGNHSFDPAYGTNHKFYGLMDYFYVGNAHGQNGNSTGLLTMYVRSLLTLNKTSSLSLDINHFQSPVRVYAEESSETLAASLGEEIDLVYHLNLSADMQLKVGYSQMFGTSTLEVLKSSAPSTGLNQWAWAMLSLKPTLFTQYLSYPL